MWIRRSPAEVRRDGTRDAVREIVGCAAPVAARGPVGLKRMRSCGIRGLRRFGSPRRRRALKRRGVGSSGVHVAAVHAAFLRPFRWIVFNRQILSKIVTLFQRDHVEIFWTKMGVRREIESATTPRFSWILRRLGSNTLVFFEVRKKVRKIRNIVACLHVI